MTEKPCVFCDRSQFEERLIAEDENFYVVASLGQITDGGYVPLIPKGHASCVGAMDASSIVAMEPVIAKIRTAISAEYVFGLGLVTIFEHGIVGQTIQHAHLHFVPGLINFLGRLGLDFIENDYRQVWSWQDVPRIFNQRRRPYLLCSNFRKATWLGGIAEDGLAMLVDPPAHPQYFRTVLAKNMGRPERANWRTMNPELDRQLWSATVSRLRPYFA